MGKGTAQVRVWGENLANYSSGLTHNVFQPRTALGFRDTQDAACPQNAFSNLGSRKIKVRYKCTTALFLRTVYSILVIL